MTSRANIFLVWVTPTSILVLLGQQIFGAANYQWVTGAQTKRFQRVKQLAQQLRIFSLARAGHIRFQKCKLARQPTGRRR